MFFKIAVGLLSLSLIVNLVQWSVINNTKYKLSVQEQALALAAKEYAEYKLAKEREMSEAITAAEVKHQQEQDNATDQYEDLLACVRSGKCGVQKRFTCPPRPANPGEAGSAGEGEEAGLSREDAEFLISEANRADEVTRELNLAKEYIDILERIINGR
jgi:hypothetical protein